MKVITMAKKTNLERILGLARYDKKRNRYLFDTSVVMQITHDEWLALLRHKSPRLIYEDSEISIYRYGKPMGNRVWRHVCCTNGPCRLFFTKIVDEKDQHSSFLGMGADNDNHQYCLRRSWGTPTYCVWSNNALAQGDFYYE